MKIKSTKFRGLKVFYGKNHTDQRGTFREIFIKKKKIKGFKNIFWCMSRSKKMLLEVYIFKKIKIKQNMFLF